MRNGSESHRSVRDSSSYRCAPGSRAAAAEPIPSRRPRSKADSAAADQSREIEPRAEDGSDAPDIIAGFQNTFVIESGHRRSLEAQDRPLACTGATPPASVVVDRG